MAKRAAASNAKRKTTRKPLPRSRNGRRRDDSWGGSMYTSDKEHVRQIARAQGISINHYIHQLLWRDQWWKRRTQR